MKGSTRVYLPTTDGVDIFTCGNLSAQLAGRVRQVFICPPLTAWIYLRVKICPRSLQEGFAKRFFVPATCGKGSQSVFCFAQVCGEG